MKHLLVIVSLAVSGAACAQALPIIDYGPASAELTIQQVMQYAVGNEARGGSGDACATADITKLYKLDAYGAILQCDTYGGRWERARLTDRQERDLFLENAKWNDGIGGIPVY